MILLLIFRREVVIFLSASNLLLFVFKLRFFYFTVRKFSEPYRRSWNFWMFCGNLKYTPETAWLLCKRSQMYCHLSNCGCFDESHTKQSWNLLKLTVVHIFLWVKDENSIWGCVNGISKHGNCLNNNMQIWFFLLN